MYKGEFGLYFTKTGELLLFFFSTLWKIRHVLVCWYNHSIRNMFHLFPPDSSRCLPTLELKINSLERINKYLIDGYAGMTINSMNLRWDSRKAHASWAKILSVAPSEKELNLAAKNSKSYIDQIQFIISGVRTGENVDIAVISMEESTNKNNPEANFWVKQIEIRNTNGRTSDGKHSVQPTHVHRPHACKQQTSTPNQIPIWNKCMKSSFLLAATQHSYMLNTGCAALLLIYLYTFALLFSWFLSRQPSPSLAHHQRFAFEQQFCTVSEYNCNAFLIAEHYFHIQPDVRSHPAVSDHASRGRHTFP